MKIPNKIFSGNYLQASKDKVFKNKTTCDNKNDCNLMMTLILCSRFVNCKDT